MGITQTELQNLIDVADLVLTSKYDPFKGINLITTACDRMHNEASIINSKFDDMARVACQPPLLSQTLANSIAHQANDIAITVGQNALASKPFANSVAQQVNDMAGIANQNPFASQTLATSAANLFTAKPDFTSLAESAAQSISKDSQSVVLTANSAAQIFGSSVSNHFGIGSPQLAANDCIAHACELASANVQQGLTALVTPQLDAEQFSKVFAPPQLAFVTPHQAAEQFGKMGLWALEPERSLQVAIKNFTDFEFGRLNSVRDFTFPENLYSVSNTRKALEAVNQFYKNPYELSLKAFEPLRHYYTELECNVNSVTVDISHGSEKVIHAEYERKNATEILTAMIVLKGVHPKARFEVKGDYADSEGLLDCSGDYDTHYAEFQGQLDIYIEDDTNPISITDCFEKLVQDKRVNKEELEHARFLALSGERFFRRTFPRFFYHGLLFLAEAAANHVLDKPMSAKEYRGLERMMGDSLRGQLPKPSTARNNRGGDAWKIVTPQQFAKRVDELYDLAGALVEGYKKYSPNTRWLDMLKLSYEFAPFYNVCDEQVINTIAVMIPARLKECRSISHKHSSTPLAFACELAAHELNIRKTDGNFYSVDYMLRKYREGYGVRGKQRIQAKAGKKSANSPQK